MVCAAEVGITAVYRAGVFGVGDKKFEQTFFMIFETSAFDRCESFGDLLVYLFQFAGSIEVEIPVIIIDLFCHIKGSTVAGRAEFASGTKCSRVVFFGTFAKGYERDDKGCGYDYFWHENPFVII